MKQKNVLFILLMILFVSCNNTEINHDEKNDLVITTLDRIPDEIEGCPVCYLSETDSLFNSQKHLFASNSEGVAYMKINNELTRFVLVSATREPFTFKKRNLTEKYSNEKYELIIKSIFEDSTSYESWNFNGSIQINDKKENTTSIKFVGACGC